MAGQEENERLLEGLSGETVFVKVGDPATLPGLKEIKTDEVIEWRFGDKKILIARVKETNNPITFDNEHGGIFKGRLTLDGKTGDLTISNTKNTDFGIYEISNTVNIFSKNVTLSVAPDRGPSPGDSGPSPGDSGPSPGDSGLSSGAIAGIVIAVVAVLAAAAVGIYYGYWKKKQML